MSGFDVIIYIAGLILLTRLFMKELIGIVLVGRRLLAAVRDPLPPSRQLEHSVKTRSDSDSDLSVRSNTE